MNQPADTLTEQRAAEYRWWLSIGLYIVVGCIAVLRYAGPPPRSAQTEGVSSARALETLDMLLGEQQLMHTAGSKENEHVRVRLLGALDELAAQTWILPLANDEEGERSGMANIVARIEGQPRARPVVLATHYDSSRFGPGAGDAGQCVAAILETVRALKSTPLQYEFWCLFTDGEERGLWGAGDLLDQAKFPWGDELPLVINFDARGDRGAVLLYETHANNLSAMRLAAAAIAHPRVSTSLMVNVYKRLPNGTDFTVFHKAGWPGWNFAVVAGADRYHTAEDTIANLSPRSIQHFAAHALGLLRSLDDLDPTELEALEDSQPGVFFDVLGLFLIVYPASWNWWHLGLVGFMLVLACACAKFRMRWSRCVLVVVVLAIGLVVSWAMGMAITRGLQAADVLPRNFVSYYEAICLVYPLAAILVVLGLGRVLTSCSNRVELLTGTVLFLFVLAIRACLSLPGGAYLLLWPATWLAALLILDARCSFGTGISRRLGFLACIAPALLDAPTYVLLAQAMGPRAGSIITAGSALMLLPTLISWAQPTVCDQNELVSANRSFHTTQASDQRALARRPGKKASGPRKQFSQALTL